MRKLILLLAILALAACQAPTGSSADVEVYEFEIEPSLTTFEAGTVNLNVENEGEYGHTLVITNAEGQVLFAGGVTGPGETAQVSIDLAPGEYHFTCRIVAQDDEGNVIDHYEQGMSADVAVVAS
jgi:hypothetical protein